MKIPLPWLKQYIETSKSPEELAELLTMTGTAVEDIQHEDGADILRLEITTNRPDCLSVHGIAREMAGILKRPLKPIPVRAPGGPATKNLLPLRVAVLDKKGCPRYTARVLSGVKVKASSSRVIRYLGWMGQKAINNVVDATNFCLYEIGQPLHAFDYDKIRGNKIVVRRAQKGEKLLGINGVTYELDERILVIADAEKPVAIAGVMGGKETEVTESTQRVILESARFDPILVRRAGRLLKISTESSYRFERTVAVNKVIQGSDRVASLLVDWASASVASRLMDVHSAKPPRHERIRLKKETLERVLGSDFAMKKAAGILQALGFKVKALTKEYLVVKSLLERQDVKEEIDLVEEVIRLAGFENIHESIPSTQHAAIPIPGEFGPIRRIKEHLVSRGFREAVTYSLAPAEGLSRLGFDLAQCVKIQNPLSHEQGYLRPSGLWGLLGVAARNVSHKEKNFCFFEIGKRFLADKEENMLSFIVTGEWLSSWAGKQAADFFFLKGEIESLVSYLRRGEARWSVSPESSSGRFVSQLMLKAQGHIQGYLAEIHPRILNEWDIPQRAFYAELSLDTLVGGKDEPVQFRDIPRFPSVRRDISFIVDSRYLSDEIMAVFRQAAQPYLKEVKLFDQFAGKNIPKGKRSLAYSLEYQKPDGTFTDEETQRIHEGVVSALKNRFQVEIR